MDRLVQTISVCVKNENTKTILGQVTLPITELSDQKSHQEWLALQPAEELGMVRGEVDFTCSLMEGKKFSNS